MRHITCNMRHITCNMRHITCNMRHITCNMRHITCTMRRSKAGRARAALRTNGEDVMGVGQLSALPSDSTDGIGLSAAARRSLTTTGAGIAPSSRPSPSVSAERGGMRRGGMRRGGMRRGGMRRGGMRRGGKRRGGMELFCERSARACHGQRTP